LNVIACAGFWWRSRQTGSALCGLDEFRHSEKALLPVYSVQHFIQTAPDRAETVITTLAVVSVTSASLKNQAGGCLFGIVECTPIFMLDH
jgi:hypothetical protein